MSSLSIINAKLNLFRSIPIRNFIRLNSKQMLEYKFGSPERIALEDALKKLANLEFSVPIITSKEHYSGDEQIIRMPYNHQRSLAKFYYANRSNIETAIDDILETQKDWRSVNANQRGTIWRKCADIIDKEDRYIINAAVMLGQGMTWKQADHDTTRLVESLRYSAEYLRQISEIKQTQVGQNIFPNFFINPLSGFVLALCPFNSVCLSANLAFCPALMGNVVIWKPSTYCVLSSFFVLRAMMKAGLPNGVINFLPANARLLLDITTKSPHLAGISFGGSTAVFRDIWHVLCNRRDRFNSIPILSGESAGNNFHFVHESANIDTVVYATIRAAFEYSGQKNNSCTRLYVPESLWSDLRDALTEELDNIKVGPPCDFTAFTSSVINEPSFERLVGLIKYAQSNPYARIIYGGDHCKTLGYFIEPTVCQIDDPQDRLFTEPILGPILSVYVYENKCLDDTLNQIAKASKYAYSGSIFATDDMAICQALKALRMSASNIYINEKCTGAYGGHPPFSGGRLASTNDKFGSAYYLLRWGTLQLVEESFPQSDSNEDAQSL